MHPRSTLHLFVILTEFNPNFFKQLSILTLCLLLVLTSKAYVRHSLHTRMYSARFQHLQNEPLYPDLILPELIVFDLDMCIWQPEMYTLHEIPNEKSEKIYAPLIKSDDDSKGVIAVRSGDEFIKLFPAALKVLQDFYLGKYPNTRIAAASSADTPTAVKIGRSAMNYLEILPGVSMRKGY